MNLTHKIPLNKIKDIDLNNMKLLKETVSKDVSEEYGDFTFSAGGKAGLQIQLFMMQLPLNCRTVQITDI